MTGRHLSWDDKRRLCESLLRVRALHEPDVRDLYVAELEAQLGQSLSVKRHSDPRHDLFSVITACDTDGRAVRAFVQILRGMQGDNKAVREVEQLMDELERDLLLAAEDRESLVRLIAVVRPDELTALYYDVMVSSAEDLQPNWQDINAVVHRVELASAVAGGPLLLMSFVDRLAHVTDQLTSIAVHRWIDTVGRGLGMDQAEIRGLCLDTRHRQNEARPPSADGAIGTISGDTDNERTDFLSSTEALTAGAAVITSTSIFAGTEGPSHTENLRLIRGGVPIRNPDFTGREGLLQGLREALEERSKASVLPQTLHGLGGVGKTQLAVEYVYRYWDHYDLIWWISAEQMPLVLASLETLADRLGLPRSEDRKQTARTVLDSLSTSGPRWLMVFDNANEPDEIASLVPSAGGHVIITSRNQAWANVWEAIEVDVFARDESVELLRKRGGKGISAADADRLATELGDLPLALDQAASWQAATGMPVSEYLQLFDEHVQELLSEGKPTSYPTTVAAFVNLAFERLRADAPPVAQLLEMFAFLGAEPISVALLRRAREANISEPLGRALREPIYLNRTIRDLRKYGLAKVDASQRIQVHRLVQLVLRDGLDGDLAKQSRANVHNMLASANPGEPDDPDTWSVHAEMGPHVGPADLVGADNPEARRVALDQIRYLWNTGDYEGSRQLGEATVAAWRTAGGEGLGPDGEFTLIATRHLANALRSLGVNDKARELTVDTFDRLRNNPLYGEEHEHTLMTANSVALDRRLAGDFRGALALDEDNLERHRRVFGDEDPATLRTRNNLAVNLRMLGDFKGAYQIDQDLVREWQQTVGQADPRPLLCVANVARDLYGLGQYAEALELQQRAWPVYRDLLGARHNLVLLAARTIAIALRKTGKYDDASSQARENYRSYHARFGIDHEHTLAATMSYANTLRVVEKLSEARALATDAVERYRSNFGPRHPLALAGATNLAIILRSLGELREARRLNEESLVVMREVLGPEHGYTLCAANNYANDLVLAHDLAAARAISTETLAISRRVRGENHPYTLACATNASFDLQATGDDATGQDLLNQTVSALQRVLGPEHPETLDAGRGKRAECDLEPPPT